MPFVDFQTSAAGEPVSVRAAFVRTVRPARRDSAFSVLEMESGELVVLGQREEVCKRLTAALAAERGAATPADPNAPRTPPGDENGPPQQAAPSAPKGKGKAK